MLLKKQHSALEARHALELASAKNKEEIQALREKLEESKIHIAKQVTASLKAQKVRLDKRHKEAVEEIEKANASQLAMATKLRDLKEKRMRVQHEAEMAKIERELKTRHSFAEEKLKMAHEEPLMAGRGREALVPKKGKGQASGQAVGELVRQQKPKALNLTVS